MPLLISTEQKRKLFSAADLEINKLYRSVQSNTLCTKLPSSDGEPVLLWIFGGEATTMPISSCTGLFVEANDTTLTLCWSAKELSIEFPNKDEEVTDLSKIIEQQAS